MKLLVVILSIFTIFNTNAQEKTTKKLVKGDVIVKYTPTSLLDPSFPKIEFGAAYMIVDKLVLQLKICKKVDIYHLDDELKFDGFKVALEYQYFAMRQLYAGVENGLSKNRFTDQMIYLVSSGSSIEVEDNYQVTDEKMFVVQKVGYMFFISKQFFLDFYFGIGIEFLNRSVNDLEFAPANGNIDPMKYEWFFGPTYEEKHEYGVRFSLGMNIVLRLD